MSGHILDNPVWATLTGPHDGLAQGDDRFRRYPTAISILAAVAEPQGASIEALVHSVRANGPLITPHVLGFNPPKGTKALIDAPYIQMLYEGDRPDATDARIVPLGVEHGAAMMELADLTKPGPFAPQTVRMGHYWGIWQEGRLIAMAGERMQTKGFCEVSAICTHPDFGGQGLGSALSRHALCAVMDRGQQPFLHVAASNPDAKRLYERLGFAPREEMRVVMLDAA